MMTAKHSKSVAAPLTRISKKTGEPYARPKGVHEQIEAVLDLPLEKAFDLACRGQLYPQTLVYLMRNFRPNRRSPAYDALLLAFFSRLERAGDRIVGDLPDTQKEWVHAEVANRIQEWMFDNRMDIFEFAFKKGAERLYFTALAKVRRRTGHEVSREDLVDPESDLTGEEVADVLGSLHAGSSMPLAEARAELREIFEKLTEKERHALFYVEQIGLTEKEAGGLLGCSARNVRYLITSARAKAHEEGKRTRGSARGKV
jgi:DNA-directed RNA polymerase specialized sigma24 family protein